LHAQNSLVLSFGNEVIRRSKASVETSLDAARHECARDDA